jgi:hypothetical protein
MSLDFIQLALVRSNYLRINNTKKLFSKTMKITNKNSVYIDHINNFDRADFIFSLNFSQKWQIQ